MGAVFLAGPGARGGFHGIEVDDTEVGLCGEVDDTES